MAIQISHDIGKATSADLTNAVDDVTVDAVETDGATGFETTYQHTDWAQWFGYYTTIPELKIAIDAFALWCLGRGWTSDPLTTVKLERITGWGEDSFNSILKNMVTTALICGDAFAEIIRTKDGLLLNVKPLDPSRIVIVADKKGILKRYEQVGKNKMPNVKFKPNQILHIMNKRVADEIHGRSTIEAVEGIIKANNESFTDVKQLMHRHVKPIMAFEVDTDDQSKIDAFVAKMDSVINKGENIYIPKGTVEFKLVSVPSNATLNPMPWRNHLSNYFYRVIGVPSIVLGGGAETFTESSAKIAFLSFSQAIADMQRHIITQVKRQLYLTIDLEVPVTIQNELISDSSKDGAQQQTNIQPAETQVSMAEGG